MRFFVVLLFLQRLNDDSIKTFAQVVESEFFLVKKN
jgi:hypothetical protein